MKLVMPFVQINTTYHGGGRYENEELFKYFRAQIDWSLELGWTKEDIIIGTNFDFEYRGIESYHLYNICDFSGFNNFWYGAHELLSAEIIDDDFWLHDQDCWPNEFFTFPKFDGLIGGCEYIGTPQWNCGSIFVKKEAGQFLGSIVSTMEENRHTPISSDEQVIVNLRAIEEIKHLFSSIDTTYNCGLTHFDLRYESATKPLKVCSFKPTEKKAWNKFKKVVNPNIIKHLKKHELL
jgi:hypothetical protein|tara:strand:+ start:2109 stop:2816 length:708 start_codon:yes stop_codon:yes gene_type:complete